MFKYIINILPSAVVLFNIRVLIMQTPLAPQQYLLNFFDFTLQNRYVALSQIKTLGNENIIR